MSIANNDNKKHPCGYLLNYLAAGSLPISCIGRLKVFSPRFWRHLLFPRRSTIGVAVLNDSVRNGKRCDHCTKSPELRTESMNTDVFSQIEHINVFSLVIPCGTHPSFRKCFLLRDDFFRSQSSEKSITAQSHLASAFQIS